MHGNYPDYEWYDSTPDVPDMIRTGTLKLANKGDEVILREDGQETSCITWPKDVVCREGRYISMKTRSGTPPAPPDDRPVPVFPPISFSGVSGTAFTAPDASQEMIRKAINLADTELLINVYEFADPTIAMDVAAARNNGTSITILLEGGPVGGISTEEEGVVAYLRDNGAAVYTMETTDNAHARYRYDHAKYIIADRKVVLVTSENFKESGFPEKGKAGNRGGWGAYLSPTRGWQTTLQTSLRPTWPGVISYRFPAPATCRKRQPETHTNRHSAPVPLTMPA
ncbi:phospholipase D-like domain-containing protein [Methanogenium cariaci]|uniref:phospholipase D-like domain-containing protein n=1 Tax=Methanogenium cariaci TaxID=2197 RepID=UPI0012F682E0|nr:phospholipase D-like domain-containing protein [Methanogenium cariaci]